MREQAEQQNQHYFQQQLRSLQDVKQNQRDFEQQLAATDNPNRQKLLESKIRFQQQMAEKILGRLNNAGYVEKRGRPKKEVTDTYKANRIKFTAHLQKEQMAYVKELQAAGQIANISAFLDELIVQHQRKNG